MSTNFERNNKPSTKLSKNLSNGDEIFEQKILDIINDFNLYTIEKIGTMIIDDGIDTFIDDVSEKTEKIQAFVVTDNNYICPVGINESWQLNNFYIGDDGKIHLSRSLVTGGLFGLHGNKYSSSKDEFMKNAINRYNINNGGSSKIVRYYIVK